MTRALAIRSAYADGYDAGGDGLRVLIGAVVNLPRLARVAGSRPVLAAFRRGVVDRSRER